MTESLAERIVLHLIKDFPDWRINDKYTSIAGMVTIRIDGMDDRYLWLDFFTDGVLVHMYRLFEYANPNFFDDLREIISGSPAWVPGELYKP